MVNNKKKEPLCGDTINLLARDSKDFQWSITYKWYSELSQEQSLNFRDSKIQMRVRGIQFYRNGHLVC
jgi:hypothetical protein